MKIGISLCVSVCIVRGEIMSVISLAFFGFLAATLIIYYIVPKSWQWCVLLGGSLFFFVYASKALTLYMLAVTAVVYVAAAVIQNLGDGFSKQKSSLSKDERKALKKSIKHKQRAVLTVAVVVCIGLLAVLKYFNMLGGIVNSVSDLICSKSVVPIIDIALPLGISYYTLMAVSYVVDVYRKAVNAEKNPFRVLLFICYFPHIVEGPFDTYSNLAPQFKTPHKFNYDAFMNALSLLLFGLVKKTVLADRLAFLSNAVFDNYSSYSGLSVLFGFVAYTLCIYADFSGFIDIVRGVSMLFGVKIAENFKRPFFSHTVQEFWRRWHITLGEWLKNYLFYPVSLSKFQKNITLSASKNIKNKHLASVVTTFFPLLAVWLVMGIWHGASVKYVVYGLYYFVIIFLGQLLEPLFAKICSALKIDRKSKSFSVFQMLRTDVLVLFGLALFRADTLSQFSSMFKSMLHLGLGGLSQINTVCTQLHFGDYGLIVLFVILLFVKELLEEKGKNINFLVTSNKKLRWCFITVSIIAVVLLGIYGTGYTAPASVYAEF